MAEHTPGPWEVFRHPAVVQIKTVFGSPKMDMSQLVPVPSVAPGVNQEANAQLIAAAPTMLDALEEIKALKDKPGEARAALMIAQVKAENAIAAAKKGT